MRSLLRQRTADECRAAGRAEACDHPTTKGHRRCSGPSTPLHTEPPSRTRHASQADTPSSVPGAAASSSCNSSSAQPFTSLTQLLLHDFHSSSNQPGTADLRSPPNHHPRQLLVSCSPSDADLGMLPPSTEQQPPCFVPRPSGTVVWVGQTGVETTQAPSQPCVIASPSISNRPADLPYSE